MKKLIVNEKFNNKKLYNFIKNSFPCMSDNTFYKVLRKKDFKINGKRISENITLHNGDEILIYICDTLLEGNYKLNIIFEDKNILIINKPINIEVTGNRSLTELVHKLYAKREFLPMPCHRLDRNTSGLIIFAKNKTSLDILLEKFKKHEIDKHYYALVFGIPKIHNQKMKAYLFKDSKKSQVYISNIYKKGFFPITTSYSLIKKYDNNTSLLDVSIETGRTHQIRAHLSYIGYPIVGDGKYGNNHLNKTLNARYQKLFSYKVSFNFLTDSGCLNYLNRQEFILKCPFE